MQTKGQVSGNMETLHQEGLGIQTLIEKGLCEPIVIKGDMSRQNVMDSYWWTITWWSRFLKDVFLQAH